MTRDNLSRRIQTNQKLDNSSKDWCESLMDEIFEELEKVKQDRDSWELSFNRQAKATKSYDIILQQN